MASKNQDAKKPAKRGRKPATPQRETVPYPAIFRIGGGGRGNTKKPFPKATPRNLRNFSHHPMARAAINAIKNPIAMLEWEISPIDGVDENSELARQMEVATWCFNHPNNDDSFRLLLEQCVEEYCISAACIELQASGDDMRPLWMFPVESTSIKIYPGWDGRPDSPRYAQSVQSSPYVGSSDDDVIMRNDELVYIRPNPSAATCYGKSWMEIAFDNIARLVGAMEYAGKVTSNQRPEVMIDLGDVDEQTVSAMRKYWIDMIEGTGTIPILGFPGGGKDGGVKVQRLFPGGDAALYLKWMTMLIRVIAASFGMSAMNLSVEADVNRATAEVAFQRDWVQTIVPTAQLFAEHFTREVLHRKFGFYSLRFRFKGLELIDEVVAKIFTALYEGNVLTSNEQRQRMGLAPSDNPICDLTYADIQIAMQAARGAAVVDDENLSDGGGKKPSKAKPKKGTQNGGRDTDDKSGGKGKRGKSGDDGGDDGDSGA
jgi:hypothetical protein